MKRQEKSQGARPGHEGHRRKRQEPTLPPVLLDPPQEVLEDPDFKKTGKTLVKQLINIRLVLEVQEYAADVYYNPKTGERVHAAFPAGVVDDVNYGGSIRAFLFLLNNDCCTSLDKSLRFLSDLTDGKLKLSKGMASRLGREFASKTQEERDRIFSELLLSPVMHIDCTNAVVNGKALMSLCVRPLTGRRCILPAIKKGIRGWKAPRPRIMKAS